jgi:hypothetical protein
VAGQNSAFNGPTIKASSDAILDFVREWLKNADMLPSREEVLEYVDNAFDTYIGPRIKRKLIRTILNEALLFAVGELYDQLA